MKKLLSMLLAVLLILSVSAVAFAKEGSYAEEVANAGIKVYCQNCAGCTGVFGCNCCENCPGYTDTANGVPLNIGDYLECRYGFYLDVDTYTYAEDGTPVLEHEGTLKIRYYWKALCCEECTGMRGCKCNNKDYVHPCGCPCCYYEPDHVEEKIHDGIEKGKEGFTNGFQKALDKLRTMMYDFFDRLFAFLRVDVILGKDKVPVNSK